MLTGQLAMKKNFHLLVFYGLTLILGGCSFAPKYQQPALPVTNHFTTISKISVDQSHNNQVAAKLTWQEYFHDSCLHQLIAQALTNNRDLRVATLRIDRAQALYQIERSKLYPGIYGTYNQNNKRVPGDLSYTGFPMIEHNYQFGVSALSWELDFWGRVRNLKQSALENFFATAAAQAAAKISLISQIAENYLTLRELDERIMIADQTIANHQKSFRIFTRRFQTGATSQLDLLQVETLLTQAQALGAQLRQARDAQFHFLTLLVGSPLKPMTTNMRLNDKIMPQQLRIGLPSELLTTRPDIIAAEHKLKASGANIGAARAAFFPNITLTTFAGTASNGLTGLFKGGSGSWAFTPSITTPIFTAGRYLANLKVTQVDRSIAVAEYEKTIQVAFREVLDALSAHYWLSQQVQIQRRMVVAEGRRSYLAELRYNNGAAPYLEVLDAKRDWLAAEQQLVQTRKALLSSRVRLYTALGGGSQVKEKKC